MGFSPIAHFELEPMRKIDWYSGFEQINPQKIFLRKTKIPSKKGSFFDLFFPFFFFNQPSPGQNSCCISCMSAWRTRTLIFSQIQNKGRLRRPKNLVTTNPPLNIIYDYLASAKKNRFFKNFCLGGANHLYPRFSRRGTRCCYPFFDLTSKNVIFLRFFGFFWKKSLFFQVLTPKSFSDR